MQGEIMRKGTWLREEDEQLTSFVTRLGERRWDSLAKVSGLRRSGKSCRLRWLNYLRPNLKHGSFSVEEEQLIAQLQQQWGNKWSKIARRLPGRTDNEIKNHWRSHLRKRVEVQQEGEYKYVAQDKRIDLVPKDCGHVNVNYCEEEIKDSSIKTFCSSSDWGMRDSPYEIRVLDWITELQNEQHCNNSIGSTYKEYYNPSLEFAEGFDTWDYSSFLWDM